MKILGMISGTSHDGIDVAVVEIAAIDDVLELRLAHRDSVSYSPELRSRLVAALPPSPTTFHEMCVLDTLVGQAFAEAAATVTEQHDDIELAVSHGQTVFHWVDGSSVHGTLQIGQPAWIAERAGVPVVSDIRARDIAAGGQGAPLASTLDALLLAGRPGRPAALNLGGISNATVVVDGDVRAWDIGPANALMDAVVLDRGAHPAGFDSGGEIAASGRVDSTLLDELLREPYYALAAPKSTGKELFHLDYVEAAQRRALRSELSTPDLLATLAALTVRTIVDALQQSGVTEVFVSGGGAHNPVLVRGIQEGLGVPVLLTDELGLPSDDKEAVLMAVLGWMTLHGIPGTIPSATGAREARVLGSITPGATPLALPPRHPAPRAARMVT